MAKRKTKSDADKDESKPKDRADRPRGGREGGGHFVTVTDKDGDRHAVYIKGPAPANMKRGGMPESVQRHLARKGGGAIRARQGSFRERVAQAKARGRGEPERDARGQGLLFGQLRTYAPGRNTPERVKLADKIRAKANRSGMPVSHEARWMGHESGRQKRLRESVAAESVGRIGGTPAAAIPAAPKSTPAKAVASKPKDELAEKRAKAMARLDREQAASEKAKRDYNSVITPEVRQRREAAQRKTAAISRLQGIRRIAQARGTHDYSQFQAYRETKAVTKSIRSERAARGQSTPATPTLREQAAAARASRPPGWKFEPGTDEVRAAKIADKARRRAAMLERQGLRKRSQADPETKSHGEDWMRRAELSRQRADRLTEFTKGLTLREQADLARKARGNFSREAAASAIKELRSITRNPPSVQGESDKQIGYATDVRARAIEKSERQNRPSRELIAIRRKEETPAARTKRRYRRLIEQEKYARMTNARDILDRL